MAGVDVVWLDESVSRRDARGVANGVVDLMLLARCSALVISAASTYGKMAVALSAASAAFAVNQFGRVVPLRRREPCFHQFVRHHCLVDADDADDDQQQPPSLRDTVRRVRSQLENCRDQ